MFADIKMMVSQDYADIRVYSDEDKKVGLCSGSIFPLLNPDHEELYVPQNMLRLKRRASYQTIQEAWQGQEQQWQGQGGCQEI